MDTTVHTKVDKNAANIRIDSVMVTPVISIAPDAPLSSAADLLVRHNISRLPVIENRRIQGIVDRHDVLKGLIIKTG
jgi:CBS domain-containing protein